MANTVVMTFGRFNPPTIGHEKLVKELIKIAKQKHGTAELYLSQSQDAKKNPMSYDDKVLVAKEAFGSIVKSTSAKTIMQVLHQLQSRYTNLVMVVGSDRVDEFNTLLNKYNGKEYKFDTIEVLSAGERDPDSDSAEGMSASKMRALAASGDKDKFISGLPSALVKHGEDIYDIVRSGMKLAEDIELDEYVLTFAQRQKRALVMRKYERKMAAARARLRQRIASSDKLMTRARKKAIEVIRKKVAGQRGLDYETLSPSEKAIIDARVEKRKGSIAKIAMKLLPKIRKAEMERVASMHSEDVNTAFDGMLNEAKRYHMAFDKDGKPKYDRRFRAFRHIIHEPVVQKEDLDVLDTAWNMVQTEVKINESFELMLEDTGTWKHHLGIGVTPKHMSKHALLHVDTDMDSDVDSDDFKRLVPDETSGDTKVTKAFMKKFADEKKHTRRGVAFEQVDVTPVLPPKSNDDPEDHIDAALTRAQKTKKLRAYQEEHGAGDEGTPEVVKNYKRATPGQVNEAFAVLFESDEITTAQMKEFEKFVDRMFEKYKIDFEFTKHFGERMNDDRNTPKIRLKELADLIKKIYNKHGNPLKDKPGAELVVKDLQSDLNMPIVVKYDSKNDEIDIVAKTIMRKTNFHTPNPVIKY